MVAHPLPADSRAEVPARRPTVRVAGCAGLGYAVGAGVENIDVLGAPRLGSPIGDIRSAFLDTVAIAVGVVSGGLALVLFVVFAIGLYRRVGPGNGWARAGLVGGLVGPALAMVGVVSDAVLAARVTRLPDADVRYLFAVHPRMQLLGGAFVGLFLLGSGVAGLRTGSLPRRTLAWPACVIGAPLLLAPLGVLDERWTAAVLATVGFGLFTAWVFAAGLWLVLAGPDSGIGFARRAVLLVLVVAAGLVGIALLMVPGATSAFFSWGLSPPPLAAFAGGAYLGSAVVYAMALHRPGRQVRAWCGAPRCCPVRCSWCRSCTGTSSTS
ncbi:MAG: DUF4386 domain-containing protein, partial [Pseudonocardia sp.]|nr:DUF4386 domain-containing protein [Pseudonocardia sp.]